MSEQVAVGWVGMPCEVRKLSAGRRDDRG